MQMKIKYVLAHDFGGGHLGPVSCQRWLCMISQSYYNRFNHVITIFIIKIDIQKTQNDVNIIYEPYLPPKL